MSVVSLRMTKADVGNDERMTNFESRKNVIVAAFSFVICHSFRLRHSDFVIRAQRIGRTSIRLNNKAER
jgi:hypothetical protein